MAARAAQGAAPTEPIGPCFGVHPRGTDPASTGRHYPDLLLITSTGRVPIELELSCPGAERLRSITSGYAAAPNIRGVLYMTDHRRVARLIETVSARLGISELIHVQRISLRAVELRDPKHALVQPRARPGGGD